MNHITLVPHLFKRPAQQIGFLLALLVLALPVTAGKFEHDGRIVALGDLHGDYDQYISLLKANGLINDRLKWSGGDTHLVQVGDVTDRGPDSLKIIRHLMKLEKQAKRKGGRVHVLVGNHEVLNIEGDLQYVHPGEYSALTNRQSKRLQQSYIRLVLEDMIARNPALTENTDTLLVDLQKRYPVGFVEHRRLWDHGRELASWYADKPAVVQINDTLFVHAGLDPLLEQYQSLEAINDTVSKELANAGTASLVVSERGPLWYRGLAIGSDEELLEPLKRMMSHYGVSRIVVGHTPTPGAVLPRFDGRVILIDVGIAAHYGGGMANLIIEPDGLSVMHRGQRISFPDDEGLEVYLREVAALEDENSRLARYIRSRLATGSEDMRVKVQ